MAAVQETDDLRGTPGTHVAALDPQPAGGMVPASGPKLLDRMREALRSRHYSRRTEQTYRHWVKRFIYFHNVRHPVERAGAEINAFLTHLAVTELLIQKELACPSRLMQTL
jgi:hypothetical protein